MYVSRLKKNLSCFSLLSHTHTHTHTHTQTNYLFQRQQHFALSSSAIFSKAATFCSLLLGYLLERGNTLHSPSSCVLPKRKSLFPLLVSRSIFPLPMGRTHLGQSHQILCNIVYLLDPFAIFTLGLGIYYLFNKEFISSWNRNTLPL